MDLSTEEAASVVEDEANPPRPRTRRRELKIFDKFLASHKHDNSAEVNKDAVTNTDTNLVAVK
jgi:hypothetical protein